MHFQCLGRANSCMIPCKRIVIFLNWELCALEEGMALHFKNGKTSHIMLQKENICCMCFSNSQIAAAMVCLWPMPFAYATSNKIAKLQQGVERDHVENGNCRNHEWGLQFSIITAHNWAIYWEVYHISFRLHKKEKKGIHNSASPHVRMLCLSNLAEPLYIASTRKKKKKLFLEYMVSHGSVLKPFQQRQQ